MTTDKMFVLLLVMLLPLTGCLDISDNAEAEESDEENITTTMPHVRSLLIEANSNYTMNFSGDSTLKLEQAYTGSTDPECSSNCPVTVSFVSAIPMEMVCDSYSMDSSVVQGRFIPVLGGETCTVVFTTGDYDILAHFTEASLSAL